MKKARGRLIMIMRITPLFQIAFASVWMISNQKKIS